MLDSGHKILSPSTYNCSLCKMTHGILKEKQIWTQFRNESHLDMMFYHKDEFEKEYAKLFSAEKGAPAKSFRMVLGTLIIKEKLGTSDIET